MFELSRLFVPMDRSRASRGAWHVAKALSRLDAKPALELFHVLPTLPDYMRETLFPYAAMGEDEIEFEEEVIARAEQTFTERLELDAHTTVRCVMDHPKRAIPEAQLATSANFTVMGMHGTSGPLSQGVGSTALRVVQTTTHPTLLIRDLHPTPQIKRILCALDLTTSSHHVLDVALSIAIALDAEFSALFVLPDPLAHDPHGLLSPHVDVTIERIRARAQPRIDALFERCFQALELPFPIAQRAEQMWRERRILAGHVAETIMTHADDLDADLIVLGASHDAESTRPGMTCLDVLRRGTTHALVVPLPYPHSDQSERAT